MSCENKQKRKHLCTWCNNNNIDNFYPREKSVCKKCKSDINKIIKSCNNGSFNDKHLSWIRMQSFGYTNMLIDETSKCNNKHFKIDEDVIRDICENNDFNFYLSEFGSDNYPKLSDYKLLKQLVGKLVDDNDRISKELENLKYILKKIKK